MKNYITPYVLLVGDAAGVIQGPPGENMDGIGNNVLGSLPSMLEEA